MEQLPIQLKFFKKLELYQTLKEENSKQKSSIDFSEVWANEKKILEWTKTHHYRGVSIGVVFVSAHILIDTPPTLIEQNLKNLIQKGYAFEDKNQYEFKILFTYDGMLMGEVITEAESFKGKLKYEFFYCLTWIVITVSIMIIILNFIKYFSLVTIKPTIF